MKQNNIDLMKTIILLILSSSLSILSLAQSTIEINNVLDQKVHICIYSNGGKKKCYAPSENTYSQIVPINCDSIIIRRKKIDILNINLLANKIKPKTIKVTIRNNNPQCSFIVDYITGLSKITGPRGNCESRNEAHIYY